MRREMQCCDTCENRGPWRKEVSTTRGVADYWLADCNAENVSEFWHAIRQKPQVMRDRGFGSNCAQYKRLETESEVS